MGLQRVRQRIDTEKLLQWALRYEIPKRTIGDVPGYVCPLGRLVDMGTNIDETAGEPGFPAALGEPHPDALIVEHAILSLDDAAIDWPATRATMVGTLGGLLTDHEITLARLTIGCPGLVAMHARMGTRPRWSRDPEPEPLIGRNGKPVVQFEDDAGHVVEGRRGGHYGAAARCPLRWFPDPREAAFERIEYSIWWQALDTLADHLRPLLMSYEATPPAAHPSPWLLQN